MPPKQGLPSAFRTSSFHLKKKRSLDQLELKGGVPNKDSTPSKQLRREERFDRLEQAINRLNPDYRTALILARIEGLKVHEIAAKMNRSTKAVYALLARALEQIKEEFGDTESLHLPDKSFRVEETRHEE